MKTMTELVSWFQLEYPELVGDMKNCNHHLTSMDEFIYLNKERHTGPNKAASINPYHCEGDVFCHTMMVCKQAENAPYEVQVAALLHDIGKPSTRSVNPNNGRVSFYNHDAVSAFMSLEILKREELGLSKRKQIKIFNMIALHTQIYKLSHDQLAAMGDKSLIKGLIDLGTCDHEGRFHSKGNAEIPLPLLIYYKMKEARNFSKLEKEVIVLCGLPASGKSTWVDKNYSEDLESGKASYISRDQCLLHRAVEDFGEILSYKDAWEKVDQKKVDKDLQNKFTRKFPTNTTIIDMTHMSKKSRRKSLSHFGPEYKKKCVVFLTDMQTLCLRNENRYGKMIDEKVIDKMMRSFYPPTFSEFDEIEYII